MHAQSTTAGFLKQNLRLSHTKLSLIIHRPVGKLYQTALHPAVRDQVTHKLLNRRAKFFSACGKESRFDPVRKAATHASPDKATNRASTSSPPIRFLSPCVPYMVFPPPIVTVKVGAAKTNKRLFWEGKKIKAWFYSPISLSDLLSISVSVSVSAELERLERHEFCPDFAPHSVMVRSGDAGSWFSVATGPRE